MAMHSVLGASVHAVLMRDLPILWPDTGLLLTAESDVRIARMDARAKQPTHDRRIERFVKEAEDALDIYHSFAELIPVDTTFLTIEGVFCELKRMLRSQ